MPTVDIPDKICPHCGGTKWMSGIIRRTNKKGDQICYTVYRCVVKAKETAMQYKTNNLDLVRKLERDKQKRKRLDPVFRKKASDRYKRYYSHNKEKVSETQKAWVKNNLDKRRTISRKSASKYIASLREGYLVRCIISNTFLKRPDIPQDLIELKRTQLSLMRQLKLGEASVS